MNYYLEKHDTGRHDGTAGQTSDPADGASSYAALRRSPMQAALVLALTFTLQACGDDDSDYDFDQSIADQAAAAAAAAPPQALYNPDPEAPVLPFPTSLFFQGSEDGTLNLPVEDAENLADPRAALNLADGFSTNAPIVTSVSEALDEDTLVPGDTVRVFEIETVPLGEDGAGAVTGVVAELDATQFAVRNVVSGAAAAEEDAANTADAESTAEAADTEGAAGATASSTIVILPLQPLEPSSDYMVLLTNGIQDADGNALTPSLPYRLTAGDTELTGEAVAALEPLRRLTGTMLAAAAAENVDSADVVLSWTFKTGGVREVLQAVKDALAPGALQVASTDTTTANYPGGMPDQLPGYADIYTGTLEVPYYQTAVGADGNPVPALSGYWNGGPGPSPVSRFNPLPVATGTETIPVLMTVPNGAPNGIERPEAGWPVAIMQHGITGDRRNALFIADAMAAAGIAVIAIDLPLHGLTDPTDPLGAVESGYPDDRERTFGIDVLNNETGAQGPDGTADDSGAHFYNLANLVNTRDNLRQAVSDLLVLSASLATLVDVTEDGDGATLVNAAEKRFIGHSLGAIVGVPFLSYDDTITAATLANGGGALVSVLAASEQFGPAITAGLEAQGIAPGSPEAQQFLTVAQTVVDPGDPLNHAAALAQLGTALHYVEVAGDTTVPNSVATAPLAGTDPLGFALGLTPSNQNTTGSGWYIFNSGNHRSFLDPTEDATVTAEMQAQAAGFAANNGTALAIGNQDVIQAPAE